MAHVVDPREVARGFRAEIRRELSELPERLRLLGLLASDDAPSHTYAEYTRVACEDVGADFSARRVAPDDVEAAIDTANADPHVHGIMVYYPIFGGSRDAAVKDRVAPGKDIEGLTTYWTERLYRDERHVDAGRTMKAILPCTPLAILKLLDAAGAFLGTERPLAGRTVTVFNRSEVVGRPLASMLAHDGASVWSFDVHGVLRFRDGRTEPAAITRSEALAASDIVITGVPSRAFPLVTAREIREGAICINFSTLRNFADDVLDRAAVFVPRVGPMTVTMALRNALRLYQHAHPGRPA